jgi:hypothetical protein
MPRGLQTAAVLALLTLASPVSAQEKSPPPTSQTQLVEELLLDGAPVGSAVAPHAGEICMICNKPITKGDLTYLVHGQRVAVHQIVCNGQLRANPSIVLAGLRPRGAFLGAEIGEPRLAGKWFAFGVYVLLGLIFGALCAQRALLAGRNSALWFLAGLAFNVVGYAALRSLPQRAFSPPAGIPGGLDKIAVTYSPAACPKCNHTIHPAAASCPACGVALNPRAVSEVALTMGAHCVPGIEC